MPRISSLATAASTLQAACDLVGEANGLNSLSLSRMKSSYSGFGEGVCTCARCMRRAGPIREDVENKLVQITYALANVYDDSPDLDVRVTDDHRARAEEMMGCVESGDVTRLREIFLEIEDWEAEGVLEPGTAPEIATYLIISAAQVGQPEIIRLLSEWDADMEETDSIRRGRPLMHAANNGHTSAVKALVECGADPEATDDNGYTALMVAVFSDRSSAAEALLEGGAHVDTPDRAGRTALSYAAMYGSTDCIYLLAGRGADVGHIDADGNTPLELAEGSGRQSAVDALKKLQLRVKMQEKRKVKQSRTRGGCAELDAAELRAKEQEAARAAAELLEQLEKEEAAKAAAAKATAAGSASAKKKKKGKGKAGGHDHDADSVQDSCADAVAPAQDHKGHQQQEQQTQHAQQTPGKQQQQQPQHAGLSNGSSGWDPHEQRQGRDDASSKSSGGDGSMCQLHKQQHGKEHQPLVSRGSGDHQHHHRDVSSPGYAVADHQLAPGTPGAASAADGCGGSASGSVADEGGEALRREWEALLEAAARCKDATQQPQMLTSVSDMLPRCADAGISVKYGRKVLQRLQAVGPARKALTAAVASKSPGLSELEEALGAAKVCRCLLEDDLLQRAESKLLVLQKQHEQQLCLQQKRLAEEQQQQQRFKQQQEEEAWRLQQQQQQQREAEKQRLQLEQQEREWLQRQQEMEAQRKQQQEHEQLRKQQQEQELLQQQRQREERERQQQLQKQQQEGELQQQQQRHREEQERFAQEQVAAQQRSWQQQRQQQRLQADQAAIAAAAAAGVSDPTSPRPPARQLSGASSAAAAVGPADPELLPQQLPSRQQQLQQLQLQQQQQQPLSPHALPQLSAQQLPQSRLSMLGAQQQQSQQQQLVSSLQQAALQSLQGASSSALLGQQQQQERQLAMQLIEQAAAAQTAMSSAMPVGPLLQDPQQQHQQQQAAALSQLQLLHQQRLFAAQLQGQAGGALQGGPGLRPGGLMGAGGSAGVGGIPQPGSLLGAGGSGRLLGGGVQQGLSQSSQGLSQAQLQLQRQQQQQLASSYWGSGAADPLLSPGGFGSVGQPLPGRLSAEILPPGPPAVTIGLASGPALHDLARSGSLGPVGGPGPVGPRGGLRGSNLSGGALGGLGAGVLGGGAGGGVGGAVNQHTGLPAEADMLDDHLHPAFSMAHAVLDDDEQNMMVLECRLCGEGRANTCCLPCGCLCMCASCAGRWRQQDLTGLCPFCMRGLEDFAVVS